MKLEEEIEALRDEITKQHTIFYINTVLNMLIFCFVLGIVIHLILG